ncbi:MAG: hypothetical protein LBU07_05495 [Coriobacteriales bacterium]|jgi:peptidoglycan hydrolase CwlO-like protein|nr:hypothetical protein [Coriobacteriales bacterium]
MSITRSQLQAQIDQYERRRSAIVGEIANHEGQISSLTATIANYQSVITSLEAERAARTRDRNEHEGVLRRLRSDKERFTNYVSRVQKSATSVDVLSASVCFAQAYTQNMKGLLYGNQLRMAREGITSAENLFVKKINSLYNKVAEINRDIARKKNAINQEQDAINRLRSLIAELENARYRCAEKIAELRSLMSLSLY